MLMSPGIQVTSFYTDHEHAPHITTCHLQTLVTIIILSYSVACRYLALPCLPTYTYLSNLYTNTNFFCQSCSVSARRTLWLIPYPFVFRIRRTNSRTPKDTFAAEKERDLHRQQVRPGRVCDPMPITKPGIRPSTVRAQQSSTVVASHHDKKAGDFRIAKLGSRRMFSFRLIIYAHKENTNFVYIINFPLCFNRSVSRASRTVTCQKLRNSPNYCLSTRSKAYSGHMTPSLRTYYPKTRPPPKWQSRCRPVTLRCTTRINILQTSPLSTSKRPMNHWYVVGDVSIVICTN